YFGSYNLNNGLSAINFRGETVKMQAYSDVTPGSQYHIKLVIQARGDGSCDHAVVLDAGSLSIAAPVLGENHLIDRNNGLCVGDEIVLDTAMDPNDFAFQWVKDSVEIPGETNSFYVATETGEYSVEITSITGGCIIDPDPVTLQFYNEIILNHPPLDLSLCAMVGGVTTFDLRDSEEGVTNSQATFT